GGVGVLGRVTIRRRVAAACAAARLARAQVHPAGAGLDALLADARRRDVHLRQRLQMFAAFLDGDVFLTQRRVHRLFTHVITSEWEWPVPASAQTRRRPTVRRCRSATPRAAPGPRAAGTCTNLPSRSP